MMNLLLSFNKYTKKVVVEKMGSKILYSLPALLFILQLNAQDISGKWRWNSDDGQLIFSIDLVHVTRDRVAGVHCVESFEEELTECHDPRNDYTLRLAKIAPNIFQGSLLSIRNSEFEMRDIQLQYLPRNNRMIFTVTKIPETSLRVPMEAIMIR